MCHGVAHLPWLVQQLNGIYLVVWVHLYFQTHFPFWLAFPEMYDTSNLITVDIWRGLTCVCVTAPCVALADGTAAVCGLSSSSSSAHRALLSALINSVLFQGWAGMKMYGQRGMPCFSILCVFCVLLYRRPRCSLCIKLRGTSDWAKSSPLLWWLHTSTLWLNKAMLHYVVESCRWWELCLCFWLTA